MKGRAPHRPGVRVPPGVYRVERADTVAGADPLAVVRLTLAGILGKAALLERFSTTLSFPDPFGANWDALEDCLTDLSWMPTVRAVLIDGHEPLAAAAPADFATLLDILRSAAGFWREQRRGFVVCFVDPRRRLALPDWPGDGLA